MQQENPSNMLTKSDNSSELWNFQRKVAILKVKAHERGKSPESEGNERADKAAKEAAVMIQTCQETEEDTMTLDKLKELQKTATDEEKDIWTKNGATELNGIWATQDKVCLPQTLYPYMATIQHGRTHVCKQAMVDSVREHWIAPGFYHSGHSNHTEL